MLIPGCNFEKQICGSKLLWLKTQVIAMDRVASRPKTSSPEHIPLARSYCLELTHTTYLFLNFC